MHPVHIGRSKCQPSAKLLAVLLQTTSVWSAQRSRSIPKRVAEIINGIENIANDQDDIIVFGRDKEQHDKALRDVLDRIRESGLKLNGNKCRI